MSEIDPDRNVEVDQKRQRSAATRRFETEAAANAPNHPLIELTLARLREFIREPEAVFWVFIFPVLLAFALGIAFRNSAPEKNRVAVTSGVTVTVPSTGNLGAAELAATLSRSPEIDAVVLPPEEAARQLRTGKVSMVIAAGGPSGVEYQFDPTRPESRIARLTVNDALQRAMGRKDLMTPVDETVTEPGARYIDFLIPGLVGMNLMGSGMWMLGFAVVQARTQKLLRRLAATPMRRSHYLLSFMLSRLVFLVLEVGAVIGFAWIAFDVTVQGSFLDVAIISLVGAVTFAGIGLLVAARPKTVEGVSGLMNLVMLPMWLLSGTFFSAARFPDVLQPVIKALPLTALNDALRSVMNEGLPLSAVWPELGILLAWGVVGFVVALRFFRWQ